MIVFAVINVLDRFRCEALDLTSVARLLFLEWAINKKKNLKVVKQLACHGDHRKSDLKSCVMLKDNSADTGPLSKHKERRPLFIYVTEVIVMSVLRMGKVCASKGRTSQSMC